MIARQALPTDAEELVRLRAVLLKSMSQPAPAGSAGEVPESESESAQAPAPAPAPAQSPEPAAGSGPTPPGSFAEPAPTPPGSFARPAPTPPGSFAEPAPTPPGSAWETTSTPAQLLPGSALESSPGWNDDWREPTRQILETRLAEPTPTLVAFVVDHPDRTSLAACVVGSVEYRLGNPTNVTGRVGYVFSVATDPDMRRRGYSRACMTALLDWYRNQGITKIDLHASAEAEPLYRSLGFARTKDPAMRLDLSVPKTP